MDFLVGNVRRHLNGSRTKSRSLPLYAKGHAGPDPSGATGEGPPPDPGPLSSILHKRASLSSPKMAQVQERRGSSFARRRNSSSCLPSPGQRSDSDSSPSDTTSCSSMEFLPASSFLVPGANHGQDADYVPKVTPGTRRDRLDAVKARVTAQRNNYKNESSSSSEEDKDIAQREVAALPRFHSDEALHRPIRGRNSRRGKRRSQDLEALEHTQVSRSDPQLPSDSRPPPVTWQESDAYLVPRNTQGADETGIRCASDDLPAPRLVRKRSPSPILSSHGSARNPFVGAPAARKPLTVNVHGSAGHFQPASPCDSGLGSHSVTSSPSLGRVPTPPLRSPKQDGHAHRLPPSLNSTPGAQSQVSGDAWWLKKQSLLSQMSPGRTDVASPRLVSRVYAYTDQAPRPSAYLSDSQVDPARDHTEAFNRRLDAWKAMESASRKTENSGSPIRKSCFSLEVKETSSHKDKEENRLLTDVCRSRSVVWPKDFSNGVSRSPVFDGSPRSSPLVWARKETSSGHSPTPARAMTPSSVQGNSSPASESTPLASPVPRRLWSPPVQSQSPNREPVADTAAATIAVPLPPTRVGSLDTARRSVDTLVERERRRRCSEHLEDALQELETIYQSLRLNEDEELLDRAERRDVQAAWRTAPGARWPKRYSIADPTGGFPLARSFSDQHARIRRSTVPDKVADDLAIRKWQQRPAPTSRSRLPVEATISPSYLLCSPAYTPSISVQPATQDVTCSSEADPELDDVGFRKFSQSQRQPPPQPPFGIPLEPSGGSPASSYIYAEAADETEGPDWRNSKKNVEADPHRDDLAYRNLRRESLLRPGTRRSLSAFSDLEDWTRPVPPRTTTGESMASIIAALEDLGQRSPPPVPKRRSVPCSGQKRLHGLTFRA